MLPTIPAGSGTYVLSLIGGIGGSMTMLSYNYWMREEGMRGAGYLSYVRGDVARRLRVHGDVRHLDHADRQHRVLPAGRDASPTPQAVPRMASFLGTILGPFGV